jgi:hypothetical protein
MPARGASDAFGVPLNIVGRHPEDFYSIMGRIITLSATLENQILVFYQYLVGRDQTAYTDWPMAKLIRAARKEVKRLPSADGDLARQWLRDADAFRKIRNEYVHSLWPAQSGGRLFGWSPSNNEKSVVTIEKTMDDMRADLDSLIELLRVPRLHRIQGLVSGGRHLAN